MYELSLFKKFISDKESYARYRNFVSKEDIMPELLPILDSIDLWYRNHTETPEIEDISNLVFSNPVREPDTVKQALTRLDSVNGVETVQNLLEGFKTKRTLLDISSAAYDAQRGYKSVSEVLSLAEKLEQPAVQEIKPIEADWEGIFDFVYKQEGLRWRLQSLNRSLGSLRKGDFGFVFARPETGKTTFLASEVTNMASQLSPESGPILWFNNEEEGKKVLARLLHAALGATKDQVLAHQSRAISKYNETVGKRIEVIDDASTWWEIERVCERLKPSLIIIDQLDNVLGFDADRSDLIFGKMYKWARRGLAHKYCPVIAVCQSDVTGENQRWLYMNNVANAKTEKQAAADFIIGIGKVHEPGFENVRFINISKNKLTGDPDTESNMRHAKIEVLIRPDIARYEDV
jgi:replicative DNA helicase